MLHKRNQVQILCAFRNSNLRQMQQYSGDIKEIYDENLQMFNGAQSQKHNWPMGRTKQEQNRSDGKSTEASTVRQGAGLQG